MYLITNINKNLCFKYLNFAPELKIKLLNLKYEN